MSSDETTGSGYYSIDCRHGECTLPLSPYGPVGLCLSHYLS
jgi:hypothetical protein